MNNRHNLLTAITHTLEEEQSDSMTAHTIALITYLSFGMDDDAELVLDRCSPQQVADLQVMLAQWADAYRHLASQAN